MKQPIPVFEAHVKEQGKMHLFDHERDAIKRWVSTFKVGTKLDITIRKHNSKRSDDQNAYYFGVVVPIIADHFGYDSTETCHDDLKLKFNPVESKIQPGKIIGGSTTKMDTVEFFSDETSYVERICRWFAVEHGGYIPPPKKAEKGKK